MTVKPPNIRPHTPTKQAAEKQLREAMANALDTDHYIPCGIEPDRWYAKASEDRQRAALHCRACPVVAECGAYAHALPAETWGVWGGLDMSLRTRRTKTDRTCERCGTEYSPTYSGQLYCGTTCSRRARVESQREYDRKRGAA